MQIIDGYGQPVRLVVRCGRAKMVEMTKAVASIGPQKVWTDSGYRCELRRSPAGIAVVTIDHPSMPLPFHMIIAAMSKARRMASEAIDAIRKGDSPMEGMFRARELPVARRGH